MPVDPGLSSDMCIRMEPGAAPNFWLSEDVKITNPKTGVALPGAKNDVTITVRRSPNDNCNLPMGTEFIEVDLYICNPTASPLGPGSPNVKKILDATGAPPAEITVDLANLMTPGAAFPKTIKWNLPALGPTSHPAETAGHKCLIARAYPDPLTASATSLTFLPDDQHYAQRNICIQTCSSPCGVELVTENPEENQEIKAVTFLAVADLQPSAAVMQVALPLLREVPEFRRVVNRAPRLGFGLDLPDFPDAQIEDQSRPDAKQLEGCLAMIRRLLGGGAGPLPGPLPLPGAPSYKASVRIEPGQYSTYRFVTDLDGSEPGDAHIIHLMHMERDRVLSGITLVMVKRGLIARRGPIAR